MDASLEQTERRFSRAGSAQLWDDMYSGPTISLADENFRRRRDYAIEYLAASLSQRARVLDLGCGTGPVLAELRRRGLACVGIDYAPDMLAFAAERLRRLAVDDSGLLRGDCRRIPFPDASFDAVVCLGVISYVQRYDEVLREVRRVLKPGGVMIVSFRNKFAPLLLDPVSALKFLVKACLGRSRAQPYKIGRFMDHREVTREAAAAGFSLRAFKGIGIGPLRLNGARLLGERASMTLSAACSDFLGATGSTRAMKWIADVSIWVYAKPKEAQ